ncbi:MAG: hypothetical protein M3Y23_02325, partial [Actinomycetota bacterium]|nr:hypothetical protein [Actinomycetota bacterium]
MSSRKLKYLLLLSMCVLAFGLVACGSDDSSDDSSTGDASGELTIGSKNFTEQIVLGEIYAQALESVGYDVTTDLNLGSETVALQALKKGEISGYPEYISTALTSFYDTAPEDVPGDPTEAFEKVKEEAEKDGLVAFPQTPFASANAVGMLTETAEDLGVTKISDLEGKDADLKLFGAPECRQRVDCLLGLQENYGLNPQFTPVAIDLRYTVLDKGQADASILFTTDAQLGASDKYTILEDDLGVLPAGNVTFLTTQEVIDEAGPQYQETIEEVQS